jgi:hypothetical protein
MPAASFRSTSAAPAHSSATSADLWVTKTGRGRPTRLTSSPYTGGTVASGKTVTATVVAPTTEEGSFPDTAAVTTTTSDPNSAHNTSSQATEVAGGPITVTGVGPLGWSSRR